MALLRLGLHVSNFMNAGSGRVCSAIKLRSLEKFALLKGAAPKKQLPPTASVAEAGAAAGEVGGAAAAVTAVVSDGERGSGGKGADTASASSSASPSGPPAYASKTLMHFMAFIASQSCKEALPLSAQLKDLQGAAAIDSKKEKERAALCVFFFNILRIRQLFWAPHVFFFFLILSSRHHQSPL